MIVCAFDLGHKLGHPVQQANPEDRMLRTLISCLILLLLPGWVAAREPNHLVGAASPYLLQHVYNPVDWYPWGPKALAKARRENKTIFVSVGYSSCHWCHVMADESFEDRTIAATLNKHFVSIKIDRESRPDLDENFMAVTQLLTGTGGWPNTVFLTPNGDPFHAGGYFPPDMFQSLIARVYTAWAENPAFVRSEAARVTQTVATYLDRKAKTRDVTPGAIAQAVGTTLAEMDPFNGGYGVAPKFPREPLFLFLLDHAARTGNAPALQAVTDMLDGMIQGGIHDHVGGGFHRYAIDPEWHVPHFEKMLYTQALTGRLLIRAWGLTGKPAYRRAAVRVFDYVLAEMRDPGGGFYSAQDADSLTADRRKVEGAYYTWTASELAALTDLEGGALFSEVFQGMPDPDLDGAAVLRLGMFAPEHETPDRDWAELDEFLGKMYDARAQRPKPFVDRKIVLSWNALMIATLAEAGYLLNRPDYYQAGVLAASFALDQMQTPRGLMRVWFRGSASIPGQLPDYAAFGLALVALHDFAPDGTSAGLWLAQAHHMAQAVQNRFGAVADGYCMAQAQDGLSAFVQIDDAEIPAGNALALLLFARLGQRMHAPEIEQDGFRLAAALSGHAMDGPTQRGFAVMAMQELAGHGTGPVRFAAKGAVRIALKRDRATGKILVDLTIADGWHINARTPLEAYLIATDLVVQGQNTTSVRYPDPKIKTLGFNQAPLALYEGTIRLAAEDVPENAKQIDLTLQACSDEMCLQPETLSFFLWPAGL